MNARFTLLIMMLCLIASYGAFRATTATAEPMIAEGTAHMPAEDGERNVEVVQPEVAPDEQQQPVIVLIKSSDETLAIRSGGDNYSFDVSSNDGRLLASGLSAGRPDDTVLMFRYVLNDAPVWTADGKFDPAVLVKLIEATIDLPQNSPKPVFQIHRRSKDAALFVSTTVAGHEQIWELLKQFPAWAATSRSDAPRFSVLLEQQIQRTRRHNELNRIFDGIERDRFDDLRKRHEFGPLNYPVQMRP